jgi:hypothetical protein
MRETRRPSEADAVLSYVVAEGQLFPRDRRGARVEKRGGRCARIGAVVVNEALLGPRLAELGLEAGDQLILGELVGCRLAVPGEEGVPSLVRERRAERVEHAENLDIGEPAAVLGICIPSKVIGSLAAS